MDGRVSSGNSPSLAFCIKQEVSNRRRDVLDLYTFSAKATITD